MPNETIEKILNGTYPDPDGGAPLSVPTKSVVIEKSLKGMEAELVTALGFSGKIAVVCDSNTFSALGERVISALVSIAEVKKIILPGRPHADMETVLKLESETALCDALIAVGSGTINDLCKFTSACNGKPYAVFGTAPSMNGYTSVNAAITIEGMKKSLDAVAASGVFLDLEVLSAAPKRMIRSGLGDSVCRPACQADWLLSRLLLGTPYRKAPFVILAEDEEALFSEPEALLNGNIEAMERLARTLVLSGFGMTICKGSYPASQGEHLISHYTDMLGSPDLPESFHGEQIGVSALTMAGLQEKVLSMKSPKVSPGLPARDAIIEHFGSELGETCEEEFAKKRLTDESARAMNDKLEKEWDNIKEQISDVIKPSESIRKTLERAGAPVMPEDLGLQRGFYLNAVLHAREIRNRYTFLDLAGDCGALQALDFVQ